MQPKERTMAKETQSGAEAPVIRISHLSKMYRLYNKPSDRLREEFFSHGKKYSKVSLLDLSHEKLTFEEIITIYTYIERADHHGGDGEVSDRCVQDGTFSNLSKRLNEIKKDR